MDEVIYQMVTKNIEPPKIVVERKGKKSEDPEVFLIGILNQFFDRSKGNGFDLDARILANVRFIIELKRGVEGIRVGNNG